MAQYRLYCAVFGCLNSSITHPEITFFKLPGNCERRLEWLQMIHRDDLANKLNFAAYRICEKHFKVQDIRRSSNRKLLKNNALPLLMLPSLPSTAPGGSQKEDKQTKIAPSMVVENYTQTENIANERCSQTSMSVSCNTPRKRNLQTELLHSRKIIKLLDTENKTQEAEKEQSNKKTQVQNSQETEVITVESSSEEENSEELQFSNYNDELDNESFAIFEQQPSTSAREMNWKLPDSLMSSTTAELNMEKSELHKINTVDENKFEEFGQSVATQLSALPLVGALQLKAEIQQLISQRRISLMSNYK